MKIDILLQDLEEDDPDTELLIREFGFWKVGHPVGKKKLKFKVIKKEVKPK